MERVNAQVPLQAIAPDLFVAGQLTPTAMAQAASLGIRSVVNNRPDFEHGPEQASNASIEAAALAAGLEYRFLPVSGGHQTRQEIAAMAQLLEDLPRPILAFCRSGARSARLIQQAQSLRLD